MRNFFILTGILFFLFSCSSGKRDYIAIAATEGPSALTLLKMLEDSLYFDGKEVRVEFYSEPQKIQALMMRNKVDFAILPTIMASNLYNKGVNYRVLGIPIWGTLHVVTNNPDIEEISDIDGQKIHLFGQGSTADILMRELLTKKNIKNTTLNFDYGSNQDLANALINNKIEIAVLSEPLVSQLITKYTFFRILSKLECEVITPQGNENIFTQTSFLVDDTFLKKYPEIARKVSEKYASSCKFVNDSTYWAGLIGEKHEIFPDSYNTLFSVPLCNIDFQYGYAVKNQIIKYLTRINKINPESTGNSIPENNFVVTEAELKSN
jgi:NitT/TauT family transport system substrate-binding protein